MNKQVKVNTKKKKRNYSKTIITMMIILWFIVALFGMVIIVINMVKGTYLSGLEGLFNYVGMPMTGGILGYLISKSVENREKIKANPDYIKNEDLDKP